MAITNFTTRLAEELQKETFLGITEAVINDQIAEAMKKQDTERVIDLGRLRDLVVKAKEQQKNAAKG